MGQFHGAVGSSCKKRGSTLLCQKWLPVQKSTLVWERSQYQNQRSAVLQGKRTSYAPLPSEKFKPITPSDCADP